MSQRTRHALHQLDAPIVDVTRLHVIYEQHHALDDISFHLHTGERVAVIGPNGAGKSTLFKIISGVMKPTSGTVKIYGHGPHGHICIAYVSQRSQVDWKFPVSVADVVMMGRIGQIGFLKQPGSQDKEIVRRCIDVVGLTELSNRQISQLSGGQQQRMFIARALAQQAELILMDEPLTGLDTPSQEHILQIMDDLKKQGITVMVATHDLHMAARHFDKVMLLNRRMICFGSAEEALKSENLLQAYGGHLHFVQSEEGALAFTDTCCEGDQHDPLVD